MKTQVNLLSAASRKRQALRRFARLWGMAWAGCLIPGLVACTFQWQKTQELQASLNDDENRYAEVQALMGQSDEIRGRIRRLETDRDRYLSIANKETPLAILGLFGQSANAARGELRLDAINVRESPIANGKKPSTSYLLTIDVDGVARSDQVIGTYVAALRKARVFQSVELKSTRGDGSLSSGARQFRIQCVRTATVSRHAAEPRQGAVVR